MKPSTIFVLTLLVAITSARLVFDDGAKPNLVVLQSFGSGSTTFGLRLLCKPSESLVSVTAKNINEQIATHVKFTNVKTVYGYNLTTLIETDGKLGYSSFKIIAKTSFNGRLRVRTLTASLEVRGVQLYRKKRPLGGDSGDAITFPSKRSVLAGATFEGNVYAGRGRRMTLKDCTVRVVEEGKKIPMFLRLQDVRMQGNRVKLSPRSYRGSRGIRISFECPDISHDGEVAETDVRVLVLPTCDQTCTSTFCYSFCQ